MAWFHPFSVQSLNSSLPTEARPLVTLMSMTCFDDVPISYFFAIVLTPGAFFSLGKTRKSDPACCLSGQPSRLLQQVGILGFPRLKKSGTCKHAASRCLKSFSDVLTGVLIASACLAWNKGNMTIVFNRRKIPQELPFRMAPWPQ